MRKLKTILFILALVFAFLFNFNKTVKAEEENTSSSATTEEIIKKESELQKWMNDNLGWLIGIPTGTLMTGLIEFIVLVKKSKKKKEEIDETKKQNSTGKEILNTATSLINDTKLLTVKLEDTVAKALNSIEVTDSKVNERVSDLVTKVTTCLETLNTTLALLENRVSNLELVQEMIALHTKELVSNGTAEEISKKIRG